MSDSSTTHTGEPSRMRQTALAVIKSYSDWTLTSIMKHRSAICVHEILPSMSILPAYITVFLTGIQNLWIGRR